MSTEIDYDSLSYIISSDFREATVIELLNQPLTPSEIAERSGYGIAHISRALKEMRDKGFVELLVNEDRMKGRIYGLTEQGEETAQAVEDRQ